MPDFFLNSLEKDSAPLNPDSSAIALIVYC